MLFQNLAKFTNNKFIRPKLIRSRLLALLLVVVLIAAACSDNDSEESSEAATVAGETSNSTTPTTATQSGTQSETQSETTVITTTTATGFEPSEEPDCLPGGAPGDLCYPHPLPDGAPGQIIDVEDLGTVQDGEVQVYRILYHSENRKGENIAVSGFTFTPTGEAPEDGWPVVAYAHGTVGMADICAPSSYLESALEPTGEPNESTGLLRIVSEGYAVVATDYEGLGTPGLHTYVVGESTANAVIDSVRAVQNMEQIQASNTWATLGISQGGHATLHTGQQWQDYAPETELVGVISMAPPSQFNLLYDGLINSPARGYIFMAIGALAVAYDDVDPAEILTDEGQALLEQLDQGCIGEIFETANEFEAEELVAVENPLSGPPWADIAQENDVNQRPTSAPVFIAHGSADTLIPPLSSQFLLAQLCDLEGQGPTIRRVYEGADHGGVAVAALDDMVDWLNARFAGETPETDC